MSDLVVADASLALQWILAEPYSDKAIALLQTWGAQGVEIIAPHLFASEVTSALYKRIRRNELTLDVARAHLQNMLALSISFADDTLLSARALELAAQHNLKAPYDAHYLALAEMRSCDLWTGDERLYNSVKDKLPWVHWIGAYQPASRNP